MQISPTMRKMRILVAAESVAMFACGPLWAIAGGWSFGYHARPYPDWSRSGFLVKVGNDFKINQI